MRGSERARKRQELVNERSAKARVPFRVEVQAVGLRIVQVLRETNGIVAGPRGAATRLGMKRTTLLSRMQRLGISVREVL